MGNITLLERGLRELGYLIAMRQREISMALCDLQDERVEIRKEKERLSVREFVANYNASQG